jgi:exonuclease 3'-5' domain-containing protein 1
LDSAQSAATKTDSNVKDDITVLTAELQSASIIYQKCGSGYLIDTIQAVATLIDSLLDLPTSPPSLYLDIEGVKLCRHGSISIIQLLVVPQNRTYLIDIHTLKDAAFNTPGATGQTLKHILEAETIPKVFFDVRNDSDALFAHFEINLAGIQDLQLMELATRRHSKRFLSGLAKCIDYDLRLTFAEKSAWTATKTRGKNLFAPEKGGSYEVFNQRPLSEVIALYCTQDVQFMPMLWNTYSERLTTSWATKVATETEVRVRSSQSKGYQPNGSHKSFGPWTG